MIRTGTFKEMNDSIAAERLDHIASLARVATAAPLVSWRRIAAGLVVSTAGELMRITDKNLMDQRWHKGVNISSQYTYEEREDIKLKAFPALAEKF